MLSGLTPLLALCAALAHALPQAQHVLHAPPVPPPARRPLVIWHGMGDSYAAPGMQSFMDAIRAVHPGIFIHSVHLADDNDADRQAGLYGNVNEQIALAADQLANVTELAGGFDAIGFSQGGQFLRAYAERYDSPRMGSLVTFGAQHMGIADIPACRPLDVACRVARDAARRGVYGAWAQAHLVQAQYYRDPAQLQKYLEVNKFLTSINNEIPESRNASYAENLAGLDALVLVMFAKDKTVVPKESAWFGARAESSKGDETLVPMRQQRLYREDWIGLRALDEAGKVFLETCKGEHMQVDRECWEPLVRRFVGREVEE